MDIEQILDHIEARMNALEKEWDDIQEAARFHTHHLDIKNDNIGSMSKLTRINELSRLKDDLKDM